LITSANDKKAYRHITLENGLQALLIHDPLCKKSATSLAVNVGHFNDPRDQEGLAHLLEHMMFLGTEKYPDPDEYQKFIRHHGGDHNAWTGSEFTNFYFSIENDYFLVALDRFSDFFIAPRLDKELIAKEIEAVDSEYLLKKFDDSRRLIAVLKETVNPEHPYSQFSVGNKQTLNNTNSSLTSKVRAFYNTHYCSSKMRVVIQSNLSLDELAKHCTISFADIKQHTHQSSFPEVPLYLNQQQNVEIFVVPDKDVKKLTLSFQMSLDDINYCCKPLSYLAYLLGHEGEGSLLSQLKLLGLANSLSAGTGLSGYNFREFAVNITLTCLGLKAIDHIIGLVFQTIKLIELDGVEAWRYTEEHNIMNVAFDFQEPPKPVDLVSHLSINMFKYDEQDIIYGDYAMNSFEPEAINRCLAAMNSNNIRIIVVSQDQPHDKIAKWYDTPYKVSAITKDRRLAWIKQPKNNDLKLPTPNPFVVERLAFTPTKSPKKAPYILIEEAGMCLWHLPESQFTVPKGDIFTAIDSPYIGADAKNQVLCRLYVELLHDSLAEVTFPAEIAGMHYDIYPHASGVTMHVSGYTPKLFLFFEILITKIRQREFPTARFDEIKQQLSKNWTDQRKAKPINRLFKGLSATLQPHQFDYPILLRELTQLTLVDVEFFIDNLFKQVHLESFVQGDWPTREVELFGDSLYRQVTKLAQPHFSILRKVNSLRNQQTLVRTFDDSVSQSAVIMYFQAQSATPQEIALWSLTNQIVGPLFFAQIRTKQQLGYVSGTSYMPINRYPGEMLYIQSSVATPNQLISAIDKILNTLPEHINSFDNEKWLQVCNGLISQVDTQDTSAHRQALRYWTSICNRDTEFTHRVDIINALKEITPTALISFLKRSILSSTRDRLIMVTHDIDSSEKSINVHHKQIDDIAAFKNSVETLYLPPD
jgi:insulysin